MHSVVRDQAGIGFTGATYGESFVLADVRMDWPAPRDEVSLHLSPEGVTVVAALPDAEQPNRYRVVATVAEAPEHPTQDDIQTILDGRGPAARPYARCCGADGSGYTTASPTRTAPDASSSQATPRTSTALQAARA